MAVFPQLLTGALVQFRFEKTLQGRAVLNRAMDASTYAAADPGGRRVRWDLTFAGLSDAEFAALSALFAESEGRLNSFTFLDPAANLLGRTEDLSAAAWDKNPLLTVTGGVTGPSGDGFHLLNAGAGWSEVWQTLAAAPVGFAYAFSVWVRGTGIVRLRRFASLDSAELTFSLSAAWKRVELNGALNEGPLGVSFAIGLPAGGQVEMAGPQVDGQLVAGEYRKSAGRGGIYSAARFAQDALESRVEAVNWIDARVSVESRFED